MVGEALGDVVEDPLARALVALRAAASELPGRQ